MGNNPLTYGPDRTPYPDYTLPLRPPSTYHGEAYVAWERDSEENGSTPLARCFWRAEADRYMQPYRDLRRNLDPEEHDAYRQWNTNAGRRDRGHLTLPWIEVNLARVIQSPDRWSNNERDQEAVRDDFEAFRKATGRYWRETFPATAATYTIPTDPDAPVGVKDPRVRHLWVQAAEVAGEEGMCGTYDSIAETAGVPTRQELRRTGELQRRTRIFWQLSLAHTFTGNRDYREIDRDVKSDKAEFRKTVHGWIDELTDKQLKEAFTVHDRRVIE